MRNVAADPRIVLVPGGFTGAWMWADVAALLDGEGMEALAVELPTIGDDSAGADFYADARLVRERLDRSTPRSSSAATRMEGRSSPRRRPVRIPRCVSSST